MATGGQRVSRDGGGVVSGLITDFQEAVARAFFDMPESKGFLLAGGAALIALGAVERTTDDLDFFAARGEADVPEAKAAFVAFVR